MADLQEHVRVVEKYLGDLEAETKRLNDKYSAERAEAGIDRRRELAQQGAEELNAWKASNRPDVEPLDTPERLRADVETAILFGNDILNRVTNCDAGQQARTLTELRKQYQGFRDRALAFARFGLRVDLTENPTDGVAVLAAMRTVAEWCESAAETPLASLIDKWSDAAEIVRNMDLRGFSESNPSGTITAAYEPAVIELSSMTEALIPIAEDMAPGCGLVGALHDVLLAPTKHRIDVASRRLVRLTNRMPGTIPAIPSPPHGRYIDVGELIDTALIHTDDLWDCLDKCDAARDSDEKLQGACGALVTIARLIRDQFLTIFTLIGVQPPIGLADSFFGSESTLSLDGLHRKQHWSKCLGGMELLLHTESLLIPVLNSMVDGDGRIWVEPQSGEAMAATMIAAVGNAKPAQKALPLSKGGKRRTPDQWKGDLWPLLNQNPNMPQADIAKKLGVTEAAVSQALSKPEIESFCQAFGRDASGRGDIDHRRRNPKKSSRLAGQRMREESDD